MENTNQPQQEVRSRREREPFMPESNGMSFTESIKSVFSNYANFSGRARRSEYWYWYLFSVIMTFGIVFISIPFTAGGNDETGAMILGTLIILWLLVSIIPTLAVVVRRLHDTGRSGWNYFISLIPIVGGIILIIWLIEDSKPGANQWGPNPKGIGNDDFNANQF